MDMVVSGRWRGLRALSLSRSRVSSGSGGRSSEHFVREHITHTEKRERKKANLLSTGRSEPLI